MIRADIQVSTCTTFPALPKLKVYKIFNNHISVAPNEVDDRKCRVNMSLLNELPG